VLIYSLRKVLRNKLIAGVHGSLRSDVLLQKLYIPIFKKTLKVFDAYHTLNKTIYAWFKKTNFRNVFFIPNGVDIETFQLCKSPLNAQSFRVIFSGRLTEIKGADVLIKIIEYTNQKMKLKDINFVIAGTGPYESQIKKLVQKYDNVIYLGYVKRKNLAEVYMQSNLFLLPSRSEGLPLSLLEAQACGLPAVASKIPGASDVVIDGVTGRLVQPGDVKSFAEAIKDYYLLWLQDPVQYYEMNKAIRNRIIKHYDWNIVMGQLERMFEFVINKC
jgi:glycosyltransferase involved in cell wall biosynthesis